MEMGTHKQVQVPLFLTADDLPEAPTTPFFEKLSEVLDQAGFDDFVERAFAAASTIRLWVGRRCRRARISGCCWATGWVSSRSDGLRCRPPTA